MSSKEKKAARKGLGITGKLMAAIVGSIVIAVSVLLLLVYRQMSAALLEKSEALLQATTEGTLQETQAWLNDILAMLETQRDTIEYEDMEPDELRNYIRHIAGKNEACPAGMYVALTDGTLYHASFVPGADFDATTRGWYQSGLGSEDFLIGDVYLDEDSQSYVVGVSGVLKTRSGAVRGVAAADVYLNAISQLVGDNRIEETGGIFLVDTRTDIVIGHRDTSITGKKLSEIKEGMYPFVSQRLRAGQMGLATYEGNYIQIEKVPGSDWVAVAFVSQSEVLRDLRTLTWAMVGAAVIAVLLLILLVVIQVRRLIGRPVQELSLAATRIAEGDLNQSVSYHSTDELGVLADDFNKVTLRLRDYVAYINEVSETLRKIANGDLAFTLKNKYVGEFEKIKIALDEISFALNDTMGQLNTASNDVAAGAEQVSNGAITLSQGSTEQAAEVEALAKHISAVSDSVHKITNGAQEASQLSQEVKNSLLTSNEKMQNMTVVIQKISDRSNEIHKIVKAIENIASQTNILALNASVEAARAGAAGKGFAVVADEVRALAGKSSAAAQETTVLLSQTVDSMDEGVRAAQDTAASILEAVSQADEMSSLINGIAEYTKEQDANAEEITRGIGQISTVVQTNVATAEQSAAASEELSGQASLLRELVAKFRLRN